MTDGLINLSEAAKMVGLSSAASIRYWILIGRLPATKVGRRHKVRPEDVLKADEISRTAVRRGSRGPRGRLVRTKTAPGRDDRGGGVGVGQKEHVSSS